MKDKKIKQYIKAIKEHYGQFRLEDSVKAAYEKAGMEKITHDDTAPLDEFHIRGRQATREMAEMAGIKPGMEILDLGCGIGGPARTLATEYGCHVTGVDIIEEYCKVATILTEKVGLQDKVGFLHRDMMEYPFEDEKFDGVITFHTTMNIEDKKRLFRSIYKVLKPEGSYVLYEICSGSVYPPVYPVPWAGDNSINFLINPEEYRRLLKETGFTEYCWKDATDLSLKWYSNLIKKSGKKNGQTRKKPGIQLVMGKNTHEKMRNVVKNMKENRIRVIQAVMKKQGRIL